MNVERRLRLLNKISKLRIHVDCTEHCAELAREKHNKRKILIEKGIIKIKDIRGVFGKRVWVKDVLVCILPDNYGNKRELIDAIFDTVCVLTERYKI